MFSHEACGMSIVARPLDIYPLRGSSSELEPTVDPLTRSAVLLPSDRPLSRDPTPTPSRALAPDALRILRRLGGSVELDAAWADPAFERAVEAVRRQLEPIRTRHNLAGSFEREAFHVRRSGTMPDDSTEPLGPVRLAYAIRWLELGDGQVRPPWVALRDARGRVRLRLAGPRHRSPATLRRHR